MGLLDSIYNLGQYTWEIYFPFSQNQTGENGAFWRLRGFILDLGGWGFAVPFDSVQNCSFKPGGVFLGIFGGGVPPGSPNSDPISDQKMQFSTPVFTPDL